MRALWAEERESAVCRLEESLDMACDVRSPRRSLK